jgi:hypothetical protein
MEREDAGRLVFMHGPVTFAFTFRSRKSQTSAAPEMSADLSGSHPLRRPGLQLTLRKRPPHHCLAQEKQDELHSFH